MSLSGLFLTHKEYNNPALDRKYGKKEMNTALLNPAKMIAKGAPHVIHVKHLNFAPGYAPAPRSAKKS